MDTWKTELIDTWKSLAVENFLNEIGVKYERDFLHSLEKFKGSNPYQNHQWIILPHSLISTGVLHVIPKDTSMRESIWEEWFYFENSIRHHVLSQNKLQESEGVWRGEAIDQDHPKSVLEINWHYHNDLDRSPLFLR